MLDQLGQHRYVWEGFEMGDWGMEVNVRDFIQRNWVPYVGDGRFLAGPTDSTRQLERKVQELYKLEREKGGVLGIDTVRPSTITSHGPGYIEKEWEKIVGLQTDAPRLRSIMPNGGIRMVESSCEAYGYELDPVVKDIFTRYRKTHNEGVFDAYTPEMKLARKAGIMTGLPDAYGRGRIIGGLHSMAWIF
jgi:formate C-acetyltransferase